MTAGARLTLLLLACAHALKLPFRRASLPASDKRAAAEAATSTAGRKKLAQVNELLSDGSFIDSITPSLPSLGGDAATKEELAAIAAARVELSDDNWVASSSDDVLLRFARAGGDNLTARLAATSEWRSRVIPPTDDRAWEFERFFAANRDKFSDCPELGQRPFMEWVRARPEDDGGDARPLQLEGSSLLILRPGRHRIGAIDAETWLRLIAWHGERATGAWAAGGDGPVSLGGDGTVSLIVDRTGSSLRNQDPALLKELLPALTQNFPFSLHKAYVAPINVVFWAIWSVVRLVLPSRVTARFTLLSGDGWRAALTEEIRETCGSVVASAVAPRIGPVEETGSVA